MYVHSPLNRSPIKNKEREEEGFNSMTDPVIVMKYKSRGFKELSDFVFRLSISHRSGN